MVYKYIFNLLFLYFCVILFSVGFLHHIACLKSKKKTNKGLYF